MKILFVSNFCPHYRVRTYEMLAKRADTRFVFFSPGDEWYWGQAHGRQSGDFPHEYLRGFSLTPWVRVTPKLVPVVARFDGDVIIKCINGRFALPVTFLIAKLRRIPFVLWTGLWEHPRTIFHRLTFPLTRYIYRHADAVVTYGEHVRRYLLSLGIPAGRVFVAPHAVDNAAYGRAVPPGERDELRARHGLGDRRIVLYVGRLEESKGIGYLLEAFANLTVKGLVLVLVGQGAERPALEARVAELQVADRVVFTGYVSPEDTVRFFSMAEVMVLPSVSGRAGSEPWGLVVNEAMNQGVPVIATTAVGAAQGGLVRPGETGEMVPERDARALGEALGRILEDEGYRRRLSEGARRLIAAWDNTKMTDGFLAAARYAMSR
ncbi:MAG: glycosyltransferase family 1 protein [Gemmatimonadetes bacterium]|nr:glycosyltransferase family 1 protein [Gemmatimonadota bacterium]